MRPNKRWNPKPFGDTMGRKMVASSRNAVTTCDWMAYWNIVPKSCGWLWNGVWNSAWHQCNV